MAIVGINSVNPRQEERPEKEESPFDAILKGLALANTAFGIYSNVKDIELKNAQVAQATQDAATKQRVNRGSLTPQEAQAAGLKFVPDSEREFGGLDVTPEKANLLPQQNVYPGVEQSAGFQVDPSTGKEVPGVHIKNEAIEKQMSNIKNLRQEAGKESEQYNQAELNYDNVLSSSKEAAKSNEASKKFLVNTAKLFNPNVARATDIEVAENMPDFLTKLGAKISGKGSTALTQDEVNSSLRQAYSSMLDYRAKLQEKLSPISSDAEILGVGKDRVGIRDREIKKPVFGSVPKEGAPQGLNKEQLMERDLLLKRKAELQKQKSNQGKFK